MSQKIISLLIWFVCYVIYHKLYLALTVKFPQKTKKGRIDNCIKSWIEGTLEEKKYLLVTHQIRNMIMTITFLASTSLIMMGLLVNFGDIREEIASFPEPLGEETYIIWTIVFALGYTFLNLILSLRHLNNFNTLILSKESLIDKIEDIDSTSYLEKLFLKGNHRFMMGRRGFLYAIIVLSWYIDDWIFVALTILLTFILAYQHDW